VEELEKALENAKRNYRLRKGIKRIYIKPIEIKGIGIQSKTLFLVNGKKCVLLKFRDDYDFVRVI